MRLLLGWAVLMSLLVGFLGGVLVGTLSAHRQVLVQVRARLAESEIRQEVLSGAISLLAQDKHAAYQAKVEAQRQLWKGKPK